MTGRPTSGSVKDPYSSSTYNLKPVTWEEFYLNIPYNLFTSLFTTIFVFTIVILGDKNPTKEEDRNVNNEHTNCNKSTNQQ